MQSEDESRVLIFNFFKSLRGGESKMLLPVTLTSEGNETQLFVAFIPLPFSQRFTRAG